MAEHTASEPRRRFPRWPLRLGLGLVVLALLGVGLAVGGYAYFSRDLPSANALLAYEPALPSHVRAIDGTPIASFAREKRVYRPYAEMPPRLIQAIVSAEDKTFFTHAGLDYPGIAQAVLTNIESYGSGRRPVGASTITQQVAKNLILTNELSIVRKLREAILARRIEKVFSKQEIMELYLNQIFLGRNSYGVEAAAQAYFGRSLERLTLPELAYLAVLPKAPANYNPDRFNARAVERRNWVLGQMAANGYIDRRTWAQASAAPLEVVRQRTAPRDRASLYFVEDVRRWLIARYGETPETGPHSVYGGGLWVRTSFDPRIQVAAEEALRDGLVKYDRVKGWRGATDTIDPGEGWAERLRETKLPVGYPDWRAAVVLANRGGMMRLGFEDGSEGRMPRWGADLRDRRVGRPAWATLKPGDVVPVKQRAGDEYALRQIPEISGGMVVQDPRTGRVLAMVGGFDARRSQFNRASQALRQPGSTFKPFVYATALDNGMTPSSIIKDGPFCVFQSARLGRKCFRNFGGSSAGAQTMRWGIEQSRNLMTVRTASQIGMDKVVATATRLGIGDYSAVLAVSLGAGETTVLRLTNAFSMLIAGGRQLEPTLVDMVQDRNGRVIYRADKRACVGCELADYAGEAMPRPASVARQALDPVTAYQVTHMLEGVVERGTATVLRDMGRPIMGKTGTTNGPKEAWFVGGTPEMVAGLYIGYDRPRDLGGWVQGGRVAAPIWKDFAKVAMKDMPPTPFLAPAGVRLVRVDRRSGKRIFGGWPVDDPKAATIWEAFRPESEPRRIARADTSFGGQRAVRSDADFLANEGGIY